MKHIQQKSLVILKPDGVQRGLIGEVIKRIERVGFKLVAMKFMKPDRDTIARHYTNDPQWLEKTGHKSLTALQKGGVDISGMDAVTHGGIVLHKLQNYMTSGPVLIMVWQGAHVVDVIRKLVGSTEPRTSDVGTIRGDFVHDSYEISEIQNRSVRNVVHASGTVEEAQAEIAIWFSPEEIIEYRLVAEETLYDVNVDGIEE